MDSCNAVTDEGLHALSKYKCNLLEDYEVDDAPHSNHVPTGVLPPISFATRLGISRIHCKLVSFPLNSAVAVCLKGMARGLLLTAMDAAIQA